MRKEAIDELRRTVEMDSLQQVRSYRLGEVEFIIEAADKTVLGYIDDIVSPYVIDDMHVARHYRVIPVRTSYDVMSSFNQKHELEITDDYEYGTLADGVYYLSSRFGFTHLTLERGNLITQYCFSPRPELGAVSFIRSEIMKHYSDKSGFLIFHASSIVDTRGRMTVFSGMDKGATLGNRDGKTTALLSMAVVKNPQYRIFSNDEIITWTGGKSVNIAPFPNQIPIRDGTMQAIIEEGIRIPVDFHIDKDKQTGESIFYTTPGQLRRMGYHIESETVGVRDWVFVSLDSGQSGNRIVNISPEQSLDIFRRSVFPRRMNQSRRQGYVGEMHKKYALSELDYVRADETHKLLVSSGTRFWVLSRGVDRSSIRSTIESIHRG